MGKRCYSDDYRRQFVIQALEPKKCHRFKHFLITSHMKGLSRGTLCYTKNTAAVRHFLQLWRPSKIKHMHNKGFLKLSNFLNMFVKTPWTITTLQFTRHHGRDANNLREAYTWRYMIAIQSFALSLSVVILLWTLDLKNADNFVRSKSLIKAIVYMQTKYSFNETKRLQRSLFNTRN